MFKDREKADERKAAKHAETAVKAAKASISWQKGPPRTPTKEKTTRALYFKLSDTEEVSKNDGVGFDPETSGRPESNIPTASSASHGVLCEKPQGWSLAYKLTPPPPLASLFS